MDFIPLHNGVEIASKLALGFQPEAGTITVVEFMLN